MSALAAVNTDPARPLDFLKQANYAVFNNDIPGLIRLKTEITARIGGQAGQVQPKETGGFELVIAYIDNRIAHRSAFLLESALKNEQLRY